MRESRKLWLKIPKDTLTADTLKENLSYSKRMEIALAHKEGKCSTLVWKSKTIQQVCKSVKTAETRSLERGLEDSIYLSRIIQEIYSREDKIPVEVNDDSKT